jgi:hypothetical protein
MKTMLSRVGLNELLGRPTINAPQTQKAFRRSTTRHRQLKEVLGAAAPLASHAKTLISKSAPLFKRACVTVRKHGVEEKAVATMFTGAETTRLSGK